MWLFDDLLKKPSDTAGSTTPVSGTGGSNPGDTSGNPPVQAAQASLPSTPLITIEKTDERSISTDSFFSDMSTTPSATPSPIVTEPTIQRESIVLEKPETSGILSISEETPPAGNMDILIWLDNSTPNIPSASNLISIVSNQAKAEAPITNEVAPIIETTPTITPTSENFSSLFGESNSENEGINIISSITETPEVSIAHDVSTISEKEIKITHTDDFIRESIVKIDSMIAVMDDAHTKKLDEAQGYKTEKERYAELEARAYVEAEKTIEEKSQAKKMKTYLEKELKHIEWSSEEVIWNSVIGTTLTTLAVRSSVDHTRKPSKKKEEITTKELLGV